MIIDTILENCDERHNCKSNNRCDDCSYGQFCPGDCAKCLEYIHYPSHAETNAPKRKYDCTHMADFYMCKYSYRYTSEIIYALEWMSSLSSEKNLKVLSFGCGPCTDLFAIDYLRVSGKLCYQILDYRGVDYSRDVWNFIQWNTIVSISTFWHQDWKITLKNVQ